MSGCRCRVIDFYRRSSRVGSKCKKRIMSETLQMLQVGPRAKDFDAMQACSLRTPRRLTAQHTGVLQVQDIHSAWKQAVKVSGLKV